MSKKGLFLKVGMAVAKTVVPGVAQVEAAVEEFRTGADKRNAVLNMATGAVAAAEFVVDKELVNDEEFRRGLRMVNDGNVLIMRAVARRGKSGGT